jgi:probable rRNA maturation factor
MVEINNKTKFKIDLNLIKKTAERFLKVYQKEGSEVSIAFVGDKTIRRLNKTYRNKDKITDVLAFPGEDDFFGEIIINYAQIKRQAKLYSSGAKEELIFILTHGLLHLLGYSDKNAEGKKKMERLGKKFVENLKL